MILRRLKRHCEGAGFDGKNPLHYTVMTRGAEPALPTVATIMKTQYAKIGVDVTAGVIDRPKAARTYVKGHEHLHGFKIRFEATWLDKP
jgi:ABC-type transport system substrate-binding protein